ncbi:MAG TPA: lysophospholipid acyltransferase family protein [Actinomycetota bacterium]|nr:lysophospholipid acyltransferase family protein [Actinomycetota bacterium]
MSLDLRLVARGWRWGRPAPRPPSAPGDPVPTDASFSTSWARTPPARVARAALQEAAILPLMRSVARPEVHGAERLEGVKQPAVIVANHASHLDTAVVIHCLPPRWRSRVVVGAAADYFFARRVSGTVAALALGAFPVERRRASAVSARLAVRLLDEGWNLVLFPEGGRSPDGWLQELKPGAAFAAAKSGRPIVPMWIEGTEHLLPKDSRRPQRGRVRVFVGEHLTPAPGESPRDLNVRLEAALRRLGSEASTDWWTSLRSEGEPYGPAVADWRRIWSRGPSPSPGGSRWA